MTANNFQQQAQFWKLKYFELLIHTQQVITVLNQPMLQQVRDAQQAAHQVAQEETPA